MAGNTKYTGAADVTAADTRYVKWVGKTKSGKAITITLPKAICLSNIDWTIAEKDDITAELEFSGLYEDSKLTSGDMTEPWTVEYASDVTADAGSIILGAGAFYVGTSSTDATRVALTRGGGSFVVERTYREINADDDPGPVEGRIHKTEGRPKLKMVALQWLTRVSELYPALKTATT